MDIISFHLDSYEMDTPKGIVFESNTIEKVKSMKHYIFLFILVVASMSCSDEVRSKYTPKPVALGRLNDVVVIADKQLWEGDAGERFRYLYESAYPIMPRPEPMFDLRHFTPEDLAAEPLRRELRTYIIVANLNDKESSTTKMVRRDLGEERFKKAIADTSFFSTAGSDKWAREQMVGYVFGAGIDNLIKSIEKSYPAIAKRINQHDEKQLSSNVFNLQKEDISLKNLLKDEFGLDIRIPDDYASKIDLENNFIFLKKDIRDYSQSIAIRKFSYKDQSQFTKASMIDMRNEYGKRFITGSKPTSYMVTNDEDLPVYEYGYDLNGSYTKEIRGVWELVDDFVGGPFISYLFHNKANSELIFIDAYVYAPGKDLRDYVQQLEYIVKTSKMVAKEAGE